MVSVALGGVSGVTFTGATIDTASPYVFVTSGTDANDPLSFDRFPNTSFTVSDGEFATPGYRAINPGDTYGIAHVSFSVAPDASSATGSVTIDASNSSLSDDNSPPGLIAFTTRDGVFTVGSPAVATPEPATLVAILSGGVCAGLRYLARRRVTRA